MVKKTPSTPIRPQVLAFLTDCKENPDDDTPRLILADWLQDHDDDRGELIRLQCMRSQAGDRIDRSRDLPAREKELLDRHGGAWLGVLLEKGISVRHRRGLVAAFSTPRKLLSKRLAGLGEQEPLAWVDWLSLSDIAAEDLPQVASSPHWRCLTRLDLSRSCYYADQLMDPARVGQGKGDWSSLANLAVLSTLAELDLGTLDIGAAGALALATGPDLARLRTLELANNNLGDSGAAALAAMRSATGLNRVQLSRNRIRSEGFAALAQWDLLARVTHFDLSGNYPGAEGIAALVASPHLRSVRDLQLRAVDYGFPPSFGPGKIGPRGAAALANAQMLTQVELLQLTDNEIGPEGATALAESDAFPNLASLDLGGNAIGDAGAIALARAPWTRSLKELTLRYNGIGTLGADALAESPYLVNLTELNFRANREASSEAVERLKARFGEVVLV